jgi:hypothetical protein
VSAFWSLFNGVQVPIMLLLISNGGMHCSAAILREHKTASWTPSPLSISIPQQSCIARGCCALISQNFTP